MSVRQILEDNSIERVAFPEDIYQSIDQSIDTIQEKLRVVINSNTLINPDVKDEDVALDIPEESEFYDLLEKLVSPCNILNKQGYKKITSFMKELSGCINNPQAKENKEHLIILNLEKFDDLKLICLCALHSTLEIIKRGYKQFNNNLDPEEQLRHIQLFSVFYMMEFFNKISVNGNLEKGNDLMRDFISLYGLDYFPLKNEYIGFDLESDNIFIMIMNNKKLSEQAICEPLFSLLRSLGNRPPVNEYYSKENPDPSLCRWCDRILLIAIKNEQQDLIYDLIIRNKMKFNVQDLYRIYKLGSEALDDKILNESFFNLFSFVENISEISKVYSESGYDSEIRAWVDRLLSRAVKIESQEFFNDLIRETNLKLKVSDLLRICSIEFDNIKLEKKNIFSGNQKKIICDLLFGLKIAKNFSGSKKVNINKKRNKKFKEFLERFKKMGKSHSPEGVFSHLDKKETVQEDLEVKQDEEDDNAIKAKEELKELLDNEVKLSEFKLKEELKELVGLFNEDENKKSKPESDIRTSKSKRAVNLVTNFRKILDNFTANTSGSEKRGNRYKNLLDDMEAFNFLKASAQIYTLCQMVREWLGEVQKIVKRTEPNMGARELSNAEKRQYKRYLYWRYTQALQIKEFIKKKWKNRIGYDSKSEDLVLRSPNKWAQRAVSEKLPTMMGCVSKWGLAVKVPPIDSDCRALLQAAHQIRLNTRIDEERTYQRSDFGDLCKAAFLDRGNIDETLDNIMQKEPAYKLSPSDRLAVCFLMTSPGPVHLSDKLKAELFRSDETFPEVESDNTIPHSLPQAYAKRLPGVSSFASDDANPDLRCSSVSMTNKSTSMVAVPRVPTPVVIEKNILLAAVLRELLPADSDSNVYLTGKVPGFLLLESENVWPNEKVDLTEIFERYFRYLGGDFDFLTTSIPDNWKDLKKTELSGHLAQLAGWTLWRNCRTVSWSDRTDSKVTPSKIPLDVVQIQRKNDKFFESKSDDDLVRWYKAQGSCVSTLDSLVLRVIDRETGRCELISGDLDRLKMQFQNRCLAIHQLEQFEENIERFKSGELGCEDVDAMGLKLLKFLDAIVGLNDLIDSKDDFNVEPKSLCVIHCHREDLNRLISDIDGSRKISFHRKLFDRPSSYLKNYLKLLQTMGFLSGFFYLDFKKIIKDNGGLVGNREIEKISDYKKHAEKAIRILSLSERDHFKNISTYMVVEKCFCQLEKISCANNFLEILCNSHDFESWNIFQYVTEKQRGFYFKRQKLIQSDLLVNPKKLALNTNASDKSVISAWSDCKQLPELKRVISSSEPFALAMANNKSLWLSELSAQISQNIGRYQCLKNMPEVTLSLALKGGNYFSVLVKKKSDIFKQKLAVFHLKHDGYHYTFSGVFEDQIYSESDEVELRVFATLETVSFLSDISNNRIALHCVTINPHLGLLLEWMAIKEFENRPDRSPILKTLLFSSPSAEPLVCSEQAARGGALRTLNHMQFKAVTQVLGALDEKVSGFNPSPVTVINGPPGTGKTEVICKLTDSLLKEGGKGKSYRVLILGHSNEIARHIFKKLIRDYPQIKVVGKISTDKEQQASSHLSWSLRNLRSHISTEMTELERAGGVSKAIARLNRLKQRLNQTMPLFAVRMHIIINELICDLTKKGSIKKGMLSKAEAKMTALLPNSSKRFEVATLAVADVMTGTLHGISAHKVQGVLEWCSFLEPDKKLVVILDEGSQAPLSSLLPLLLLKCLKHLVIVGDPQQLPPTTHSESAPKSVLTQTLRVIDPKRVITLKNSYRADPVITGLWSKISYQGNVISVLSEENRRGYERLRTLLSERVTYLSPSPVTFIDVRGQQKEKETSYVNNKEAHLVVKLLSDLLLAMSEASGQERIASKIVFLVIAAYRAQVKRIATLLTEAEKKNPLLQNFSDNIKVTTVAGAQGQQGLYTIFCSTRTPVSRRQRERSIGHLASSRRLNVALSRAQCGLFILGHWAYLRKVANGPVVEMVDDLAELADHREGLFIERSAKPTDEEEKDAELMCLARGYHKKEVWCRLKAASGDKGLQVDVLSKKDGRQIEQWHVSDVALSQIQEENTQSLSTLKERLLNLLSTSPNAYLTSVVNWAMLLDSFEKPSCESFVKISSNDVMRNPSQELMMNR